MKTEIKQMWKNEGWSFKKDNEYEYFVYKVDLSDNIERVFNVLFATKSERKYYFIETFSQVKDDKRTRIEEHLFIEPKLHKLIHKTLEMLGWL